LNFGHCYLPFDLAQGGGELVEPFVICDLLFEIFPNQLPHSALPIPNSNTSIFSET
jgi:hypothetical protein